LGRLLATGPLLPGRPTSQLTAVLVAGYRLSRSETSRLLANRERSSFVEQMLTICESLRAQARTILDFPV
jgi:hypothetical protein